MFLIITKKSWLTSNIKFFGTITQCRGFKRQAMIYFLHSHPQSRKEPFQEERIFNTDG